MIANISYVDLLVVTHAESGCIKAVPLDPDMPEPHSHLGIVWLAGGEQGVLKRFRDSTNST